MQGRLTAFDDGMQKMLWPERRLGAQSIPVTTVNSSVTISGTTRKVLIPAGTPVDYVARVDPTRLPDIIRKSSLLNLFIGRGCLTAGCCGTTRRRTSSSTRGTPSAPAADADKWALIEYLKTF